MKTRKTAAAIDVDLYTDAGTGSDDRAREAFMLAVAETASKAIPGPASTVRGNMILADVVTDVRTERDGTHVYVYAAAPNQRPEYVEQAYAVIRTAIKSALTERFGQKMAYIAVR
jgi:hypothetical protein